MKTSETELRTIGQRHFILKLSRKAYPKYAVIKDDDALVARIKSDSGVDIDAMPMSEVQSYIAPLDAMITDKSGKKRWNRI